MQYLFSAGLRISSLAPKFDNLPAALALVTRAPGHTLLVDVLSVALYLPHGYPDIRRYLSIAGPGQPSVADRRSAQPVHCQLQTSNGRWRPPPAGPMAAER